MEIGPGVWVRWEGSANSCSGTIDVSSRKDVGFEVTLISVFEEGRGVSGDAFSIAAAYAFESVLKAVGDVGSTSAFSAVADFPSCAVPGVRI